VDPSLWKQRVQKDLIATSLASGEQNSNAGPMNSKTQVLLAMQLWMI
jgi:hypothetical protein